VRWVETSPHARHSLKKRMIGGMAHPIISACLKKHRGEDLRESGERPTWTFREEGRWWWRGGTEVKKKVKDRTAVIKKTRKGKSEKEAKFKLGKSDHLQAWEKLERRGMSEGKQAKKSLIGRNTNALRKKDIEGNWGVLIFITPSRRLKTLGENKHPTEGRGENPLNSKKGRG